MNSFHKIQLNFYWFVEENNMFCVKRGVLYGLFWIILNLMYKATDFMRVCTLCYIIK